MDLIADRKGKRATPDEKAEVYRCSRHMSMQDLRELTGRSEDSISKYINEMKAGDEARVQAQAEAYGHMVDPESPVHRSEPEYAEEEEDSEGPPPRGRGPPQPPPVDDLDDLFDDDDEIDPTEENALAKKLYVLLLEHDAVKGKTDEDREYKAGVIAKTFNLFQEYQNPHGLVQHLLSNDVKGGQRKADSVSRILFGWFGGGQPGQNQNQQGYGGGGVSPVPPGFNQPFQPTGYYPGYGPSPPPYGQPPTPYGPQPQQMYPYPMPPPYPPAPAANQKGGVTKEDVQKLLDKNIEKRDQFWQGEILKRDEERDSQKKEDKLLATIGEMQAKIDDLVSNPPQQPPQGDYEEVEEPVLDEEGNLLRIKRSYKKMDRTDPETTRTMARLQSVEDKLDQEREATRKDLERMTSEIDKAERERISAEKQGQIDVLNTKHEHMTALQEKMEETTEKFHKKEMELYEMKDKLSKGQTDEATVLDKQIELFDKGLAHMAGTRKDALNAILTLTQGGKPKGANVEQWTDEELEQLGE